MKTIISIVSFILSSFSSLSADVSTFDGQKASWGWSDKTTYKKEAVVGILEKNWGKINPLDLQLEVDKVTSAEFLWKVSHDLTAKAMNTGSSFLTGDKVTSMVLAFEANGKGEITLYKETTLVGRVRCWTSSKRVGEKYTQLAQGQYEVTGTNRNGWSNEFNCKMPNQVELSGSAKARGIKIHTGDISRETPGKNEYHGCIRVSEPVGKQFMRLVSAGTLVKVVWK